MSSALREGRVTGRYALALSALLALACSRAERHATDASVPTHAPLAASTVATAREPSTAATSASRDAMAVATENSSPIATRQPNSANRGNQEKSGGSTLAEAPSSRARCNVLAVGDSLTDPRSTGGGYLEPLRRQCDCEVTNIAKGGAMVNQIRARLLTHLAEGGARYTDIVVFGGVNDLYSDLTAHRTVAKIEADLTAMYDAAHAHGARVIAFTVTPWGGFKRYFNESRWAATLALNAWIRDAKLRGSVDVLVDGERLLSCDDRTLLCPSVAAPHRDGLHFGPVGHRLLGSALLKELGEARCRDLPDAGSGPR
jgi:lysophospholipase L1-like esterase